MKIGIYEKHSFSEGLRVVDRDNECYHVDREEKPVYSKRFSRANQFCHGAAAVQDQDGYYHIYPDGTPLYNQRFDFVGDFDFQDIAICQRRDMKMCHIGRDGHPIYQEVYDQVGEFHEGFAVAQEGKPEPYSLRYFHIRLDGKPAYKMRFMDADEYSEGLAAVREKEKQGYLHIYPDGTPAYHDRFVSIGNFSEGLAKAHAGEVWEKNWFHIRHDGKPAYERRFRHVTWFREGKALVSLSMRSQQNPLEENKSCFILHDGSTFANLIFESQMYGIGFRNGEATIQKDGIVFRLLSNGKLIQPGEIQEDIS